MRMLLLVAAAGCAADAAPTLRVDPPALDLVIGRSQPAPTVELRVFEGSREVTEQAMYVLAGDPIGTIHPPVAGGAAAAFFTSDGRTGGAAVLHVTADGRAVDVPITARATSSRIAPGTPAGAPSWFASATDTVLAAALEPSDGAILPPNLGRLDVDFGALDTDDLHEIALVGPYVDVRVYTSATAGPRHVALEPDEWAMIAASSRGRGVDLIVRSTASTSHATARATTSHFGVTDRDLPGSIAFSGVQLANGAPATAPLVWRYDLATATESIWLQRSDGGCMGCHVARSPDGRHVAAAGVYNGTVHGVLVDTATGVSTIHADMWQAMAYAPSGQLVTTAPNAIVVRDGATGDALVSATLDVTPSRPAISPDGHSLVYSVLDPNHPMNGNFGSTLRIHDFEASTGTLGAPRELVTGTEGVTTPSFSADGHWIVYTRSAGLDQQFPLAGISAIRTDGSAPPVVISSDTDDGFAQFVGGVAATRADDRDPAPIAWLAIDSKRAVGAAPASWQQLWLVAFDVERGVAAAPFHLPAQRADAAVFHAPLYVP